MRRYIKIIMLIVLFIFFMFSAPVTLADVSYELDDIISSGQNFLEAGNSDTHEYVNQDSLKKASDNIYKTFFIVGFILTAIIGSILSIQFIISGVEGKAKIKESLVPYIIGCIVIFGAFGIWKISINIFKGVDDKLPAIQTMEKNPGYCSCGEPLVSPPNSKLLFCPKVGNGHNGETKDGIRHEW